jgi:protein-L-isoaspartate(D-aspartate) O-methyltransferase
MLDIAAQRSNMVAAQLRPNDVTDARIRSAMATIPRERFVPQALQPVAYMEGCIPLKQGRVLLDPRALGKLLQLAAIAPDDVVLDVGCGTGYSSAVLSLIAARIFALEEDQELAARAGDNLRAFGASNVMVIGGVLAKGCPGHAPFDVILLNGAIDCEPSALLSQLKDGGRLVAIRRDGAAGHAQLYLNHEGAIGERSAFDAQAPVLPGFEKPPRFVF